MRVFEWDARKAASNLRKHGVTFEDARAVFDDPLAMIEQDRIEDSEQRWQATGLSGEFTLIVVAYTTWDDEQNEVIGIISARRAEKRERQRYEG